MEWSRFCFFGFLLVLQSSWSNALAISYCSPDNNAGTYQPLYSIYMSNGRCEDQCKGSYAFAVIQGPNCWCSNYIPPDQVNTYSCSQACPGFPSEWCGNTAQGLYGYFLMSGATPSGTSGGGSSSAASSSTTTVASTSASSSSTSSSPVSTTLSSPGSSSSSTKQTISSGSYSYSFSSFFVVTSSVTPQRSLGSTSSSVVSSTTTSGVASTISTSSTSASITSTTQVANPTETQVYTSVTTVTGQVRTILVTPTPTPDSALGSGAVASGGGGSGLSGGTVAGIVVGVALGLGILIGVGVWFWLRRKHRKRLDAASEGGSFLAPSSGGAVSNTGVPSRQVSQMSSAGLLTRNSRLHTQGLASGDDPRSAGTTNSNIDRRSLATDQRLNPYAIYSTEEHAQSNVSLQDNQDYSRQLRVANPDP